MEIKEQEDLADFFHGSINFISRVRNKASYLRRFIIPKVKLKTGQDDVNMKLIEEYLTMMENNCVKFFKLTEDLGDKYIDYNKLFWENDKNGDNT